ncbi:MAG TPA: 50S ribosomal protein L21 [Candidatus Omnitrophota bacterium]|nr:50S ribosomal protein L21 [Candidatus Omnitrophota bacterium]
MFAIIETGGKQYKVKPGDELQIERLGGSAPKSIKLDKVLLCANDAGLQVGKPYVKGAYADVEVLAEVRAPKVVSFKYIRREKAATKIGHRQNYLRIKVKSIHKGE